MAESEGGPVMRTRPAGEPRMVTVKIVRPCVVEGHGTVTQEDVDKGFEISMPENHARRLLHARLPQAVPAGKQTRAGKAAGKGAPRGTGQE